MGTGDTSRLTAYITAVLRRLTPRRPSRAAALVLLLGVTLSPSSHGLTAPRPEAVPVTPGVFLVASPGMRDPRFHHAVILVTAHDAGGTMGLIINRPTRVSVAQALPQVEELKHRDDPLFIGGPVRPGALFSVLRADTPPDAAQPIAGDLYLTAGVSGLLQALDAHLPPGSLHSYAGYCGWGAGQLRHEIARGDWLVVEGNNETVFAEDPDSVWRDIIKTHAGEWI